MRTAAHTWAGGHFAVHRRHFGRVRRREVGQERLSAQTADPNARATRVVRVSRRGECRVDQLAVGHAHKLLRLDFGAPRRRNGADGRALTEAQAPNLVQKVRLHLSRELRHIERRGKVPARGDESIDHQVAIHVAHRRLNFVRRDKVHCAVSSRHRRVPLTTQRGGHRFRPGRHGVQAWGQRRAVSFALVQRKSSGPSRIAQGGASARTTSRDSTRGKDRGHVGVSPSRPSGDRAPRRAGQRMRRTSRQ